MKTTNAYREWLIELSRREPPGVCRQEVAQALADRDQAIEMLQEQLATMRDRYLETQAQINQLQNKQIRDSSK